MKKQFHIKLNNKEKYIVDINDNEAIDIHVASNPYLDKEREASPTIMHVNGHRWHDNEMDILEWNKTILKNGDKISIELQESDNKPSNIDNDELYIPPEEECSFCHKKKSEVKHLIAAEFFSLICDACVKECVQLLEEKENKYKR